MQLPDVVGRKTQRLVSNLLPSPPPPPPTSHPPTCTHLTIAHGLHEMYVCLYVKGLKDFTCCCCSYHKRERERDENRRGGGTTEEREGREAERGEQKREEGVKREIQRQRGLISFKPLFRHNEKKELQWKLRTFFSLSLNFHGFPGWPH